MRRNGGGTGLMCLTWLANFLFAHAMFDPSKYSRTYQLDSAFTMFWNLEANILKLGLQGRATGWIGFGLAEMGGMPGADIVYFEVANAQLVDAFCLSTPEKPTMDIHQDWTLISSSSAGGLISLEISRPLDTKDPQDTAILDDSWPAADGTRVIAAWGNTPTLEYHGANNVAIGQVRFFTPPPSDVLQAIKSDPSIRSFEIVQNKYPIPAQPTTYFHICQPISSSIGGPVNTTAKQHIVAFEFVGDTAAGHKGNVHHMTLYCFKKKYGDIRDYWNVSYLKYLAEHPEEATGDYKDAPPVFPEFYGTQCANFGTGDGPLVWAWTPGKDFMVAPNGTGFPVLGDTDCDYFELQIHYNNPALTPGRVDSSGIRAYYTDPRPIDVGLMVLGDARITLYGKKIAPGFTRESFGCLKMTEAFVVPSVTIFYRGLHMHGTGARIIVKQYRKGALVRSDSAEFWDNDAQTLFNPDTTQQGVQVLKGDTFTMDCYYYSPNGSTWGLSSSSEMCTDFLYYYPKQPLGDASTCQPHGTTGGVFYGETCASPGLTPDGLGPMLSEARRKNDSAIAALFGSCEGILGRDGVGVQVPSAALPASRLVTRLSAVVAGLVVSAVTMLRHGNMC